MRDGDCESGSCVVGPNAGKRVCQGTLAVPAVCTHHSECGSYSCVDHDDGTLRCAGKHPLIVAGFFVVIEIAFA